MTQLDQAFQTLGAPDDAVAFLVEPFLGEGGYVRANERFLAGMRDRAGRYAVPWLGHQFVDVDRRFLGWRREPALDPLLHAGHQDVVAEPLPAVL